MMIPVMTVEEVPVFSEAERAEMIAPLQQAEAAVAAGNFTVFDPKTFVARLMNVRAEALRKRTI